MFGYSQKQVAGDKTAEVNLNLQFGTAGVSYNLPGELRLRYFLTDKSAIRLRLGLGSSSNTNLASTTTKTSVTNGTIQSDITVKSGLGVSFTPGYEMHFKGSYALSPFIGAQIGITLLGGSSREVTNASVPNPIPTDINPLNKYSSKTGSTSIIAFGFMMGADYYVTDAVYIGGEFGLNIFSSSKTEKGSTTSTVGSIITENPLLASSSTGLFGVNTGGFRLGYKF